MLPRLSRSLRFFALSACLAAAASSFACSSDSGDDSEPSDTTGSGSGGKGGSDGSGNAAGEEGDGSGGDPGSSTGSGAEGGGDSSSGGSENTSGGRGGSDSTGGTGGTGGDAGAPSSGGTGGTDSGGTGGTDSGPDLEAIARGQAIAEDIDVNCSACHGVNYAGSPLYDAGNITPDEATGIGSWSDAEIGAAITQGIGKDGSELCSIMEPYDFDEGQVRDVIAFLRSLTPVSKAPTGTCVD